MISKCTTNTGNVYRSYFGLHGARLDYQHYTIGASYNYELNNLGRLGYCKHPRLSLHIGFSF